jgi:multidrug efflux system membrane fusion protein
MKALSTGVVIMAVIAGIVWWQRAEIAPYVVRALPATAAYVDQVPGVKPTATARPAQNPTPSVPVTIADAQKADFPVYLYGLGTVQPYDTVTVRSRVDGQITKVFFKQGQMVKAGELLVQIDPRPYQAALDQAKAKQAQDEASLANNKLTLQRYSQLAKQDFATQEQLTTQQSLVRQLEAQIEGDKAAVEAAQTQLDYTSINAPLSGKTGFRLVDPGNIVHASDANGIVSIVKLQPISVVFTAPEGDVGRINKALNAGEVPVEALSSDGQTVLSKGHLALVDNSVTQASGSISMKATFANEDNALWPGLSVSTRMLVDTLKGVVTVPEDAVQHGPKGLYAFVVGPDNKVKQAPIEVGEIGSGKAQILKGIAVGEKVVVEGQYRLQDGTLVRTSPMGGEKVADAASTSTAEVK